MTACVLYNLARMTVAAAPGLGSITLGAAVSSFLTFAQAGVQNGELVRYSVRDGTQREVGNGIYSSTGPTLTRTVNTSTNSNALVNLSANAVVAIVAAAEDFDFSAYAPLASPTFTGNPAAPTAAPGDNDTSIANTAFVSGAIAAIPADFIGSVSAPLAVSSRNLTLNLDGTMRVNGSQLGVANNVVLPGAPSAATLALTATTDSSSPTTGVLTVAGGIGVNGRSVFGGGVNVQMSDANTILGGSAGQFLLSLRNADTTDGNWTGLFFWQGIGESGTNCTGGIMVQNTNHAGVSGEMSLCTGGLTPRMKINTAGVVSIPGTAVSTSPTTGALTVAGGLGVGGNIYIGGNAYKPAGGPWLDSSDARIKDIVGDYEHGLAEVLALAPKRYRYKGNDTTEPTTASKIPYERSPHYAVAKDGTEYIGLIAQEVEAAMPEMVSFATGYIDGTNKVSDLRTLDTGALIYALVNAVKELAARVQALEGGRT